MIQMEMPRACYGEFDFKCQRRGNTGINRFVEQRDKSILVRMLFFSTTRNISLHNHPQIQITENVALLNIVEAASFSACSRKNSINNVPLRTLLLPWTSSTHGCAAAHTVITFTSLVSLSSIPLCCCLSSFHFFSWYLLIFHSFSPHLFLLSVPKLCSFSITYPPFFSLSLSHTLIPFSRHLSSVCLEHMYNAWLRESCEETCLCQWRPT